MEFQSDVLVIKFEHHEAVKKKSPKNNKMVCGKKDIVHINRKNLIVNIVASSSFLCVMITCIY